MSTITFTNTDGSTDTRTIVCELSNYNNWQRSLIDRDRSWYRGRSVTISAEDVTLTAIETQA